MKKLAIILALAVISIQAVAQTALPFLYLPSDAKELAAGGASISNPLPEKFGINANFGKWSPKFADNTIIRADAAYTIGKSFVIGLDAKFVSDKGYTLSGADGKDGASFTPKESAIGLLLGYKLKCFSFGVRAKLISSKIAPEAGGNTVGFDVFAKFKKNGFMAGIGANNLGGSLKYTETASVQLPTCIKGGVAYNVKGFTAKAEADYLLNAGLMAGIGAEYCIVDIVSVRAGYHYGSDKTIPSFISAGLGVKFKGFELNGTYLLGSEALGNSLLVGVGYSF